MNLEKINILIDKLNSSKDQLQKIKEKTSGIDINSDLSSIELDKILNEDEIKYVMSLYDEINKIL